MRIHLALASAAVVLAGCATTPEVDPVQVRLDDIDARVGRIDRIVSNQSLTQMAQQLDTLQADLRSLRGLIEVLQNENAKLRKEQLDLYKDLEKRLAETAATAAAANAAATAAATAAANKAPAPPVLDEQSQYARALEEIRSRNFAVAIEILRNLASTFPAGALADNTQYWMGEAYYSLQDYDQAAAAFLGVTTNWPASRKVPDALLMLGSTQAKQNKLPAARATLQQVVTKYPESEAAKKAAERLAELPRP
jgi:tol-pal system protein YbgF